MLHLQSHQIFCTNHNELQFWYTYATSLIIWLKMVQFALIFFMCILNFFFNGLFDAFDTKKGVSLGDLICDYITEIEFRVSHVLNTTNNLFLWNISNVIKTRTIKVGKWSKFSYLAIILSCFDLIIPCQNGFSFRFLRCDTFILTIISR